MGGWNGARVGCRVVELRFLDEELPALRFEIAPGSADFHRQGPVILGWPKCATGRLKLSNSTITLVTWFSSGS
jgi:hypothetical protein